MEGFSNSESIEKATLLDAIKTRGLEDAETQELLNAWLDKKMDRITTCDNADRAQLQADFELDRVDLYEAAGDMEGARDQVVQAYIVAHRENFSDILSDVIEKAKALGVENIVEEAKKFIDGH